MPRTSFKKKPKVRKIWVKKTLQKSEPNIQTEILSKEVLKCLEDKNEILQNYCPDCGTDEEPIERRGDQLYKNAMYDRAEAFITLCPRCKYIYSWCL